VQEPAEGTPHLKANVDEVVLDMAVRERGRDGVARLTPEDLIVTDEGTPVRLQGLHLVNVLADGAKKPLVTLVFDPFHGPIAKSTRSIAEKMLSLLPAQGFRMAVMDFDGRLRLVQEFTEDRAAIEKAVQLETESNATALTSTLSMEVNITSDDRAEAAKKAAVEPAEKELIAVAETGSDTAGKQAAFEDRLRAQALLRAMENADSIGQQQHVYYTVAGLEALVNAQESLRERRIIIYFTANRHMGPVSDRMLKSVADSAAAAGISVYTIDMDATGRANGPDLANAAMNGNTPSGKQAGSTPAGINPGTQFNTGYNWTVKDDVSMVTDFMRGSGEDSGDPFEDLHNPLEGVSKETGAAYIDALNGTNRALRNLAQDMTSYYEATFVPATREYDGSFHKIAIRSVHNEFSIRGRNGYYALPPGVDPGLKPYELPMLKALGESALPHQFAFRAAVLRFGELPNGNTNSLAVEVPFAGLALQSAEKTNPADARLSILAQVRDSEGVVVDHFAEQVVVHGVKQKLERNPEAALTLDHHFISAPGHYELEMIARDENSGKMSAQRKEFDVAGQPGALAISDMVLVRDLEPVSVNDLDPLEPLLFSRNKVRPALDRDLAHAKKGPSVYFLLHPDSSAKDGFSLEMQLVRNGIEGKRTPMVELYGMQSAVPYMASLGSGPLPPGDYEIKAFLTQADKTVEQSQHFVVSGKQTAMADQEMPTPAPVTMDDAQIAVDDDNQIAPEQAPTPVQLPISPVMATAAAPSSDASHELIEQARRHALDYEVDVLPHFLCTEVTRRSVDRKGDGKWRLQDTLTEQVEYRGETEAHTLLEVNGRSTSGSQQAIKGTFSTGEFGGVLRAVFRPAAQAAFTWKGSAALSDHTVQVYEYRVDRSNSDFSVTGEDGKQTLVGFHGAVFIDKDTERVRRITLVANDLAAAFRTQSSSLTVDYDYVPINGLRYLLPISAELQARQGEHEAVLNTMQFSDYRRAGAL
jgi:VWFA-related protein